MPDDQDYNQDSDNGDEQAAHQHDCSIGPQQGQQLPFSFWLGWRCLPERRALVTWPANVRDVPWRNMSDSRRPFSP